MPLLTSIVCVPLFAAGLIALVPRNYRFGIRMLALFAAFVTLLLGLVLFCRFQTGIAGYQFVTTIPWLGSASLGITCTFGVDGLNLGLLVMGTLVAFAAVCVSWEIKTHEKEFYILLLVMTAGILGAFASLDLFFFYCFHELALVPTFIMIGVWGRGENKNYATFQITLYLSVGALIALVGLIALYVQADAHTFDLVKLTKQLQAKSLPASTQNFIFPWLLFGFGILVSLWPFHTWAPLGYASAPTATAMLHAGVLKKFGLYGLLRIAVPLLPAGAQNWLTLVAFLCLGNLFYCGLVAIRQKDLNLLIGNSSVAHMGFVFLGIASLSVIGVTGAVVVMVAHGLLAALSFGLSGYLYQQTQTLQIAQLGGLLRRLPFIGSALIMAMLAGCGVPGFANFPGELLVLSGAWNGYTTVVVLAAWSALVIGAVYMLRAVRHILHGPLPESWTQVADATWWRKLPFGLLLAGLLSLGAWPRLLTDAIEPRAAEIVKPFSTASEVAPLKAKPGSRPRQLKNPQRGAASNRNQPMR
jgi:NADH-quinone oxidoreductase subunit M